MVIDLSAVFQDREALPLAAEALQREEHEDLLVERVRIKATAAYDIPAWLLIPNKRKGTLPGVAVLHCHGGQYIYGHEKTLASAVDPAEDRERQGPHPSTDDGHVSPRGGAGSRTVVSAPSSWPRAYRKRAVKF